MKMLTISDTLPDYRLCTACRSAEDVKAITLMYDNGAFKQGVEITLCKECRNELLQILQRERINK